jgi:hypothetical protein
MGVFENCSDDEILTSEDDFFDMFFEGKKNSYGNV